MKSLIELKTKIIDENYFLSQFEQSADKNILFVNPSLSGKYFYKMIQPNLTLNNSQNVKTAITNISDFGLFKQLTTYEILNLFAPDNDSELKYKMINWATNIIFPFTLQPLTEIYDHIRSINKLCKISYTVDFNFYEIPENYFLKEYFNEYVNSIVEDNCFHADTILVNNGAMQDYFTEKFTELIKTTYSEIKRFAINEMLMINVFPTLTDFDLVLENIDHNVELINSNVELKQQTEPKSKTDKAKKENKPKINLKKVLKNGKTNTKKRTKKV